MKRIISLLLTFAVAVSCLCTTAFAAYFDNVVSIVDSDLADYSSDSFNKDYCKGYNTFENVTGYSGTNSQYYKIVDSKEEAHGKVLQIDAFTSFVASARPENSGILGSTYTWNGKTYKVFDETVTKDNYYIFSFDYKCVESKGNAYNAFSICPQYEVFYSGSDYANEVVGLINDQKWHYKQVGFVAEKNTIDLKIHGRDYNVLSYLDNLRIMDAQRIIINDASGLTKLNDNLGNICADTTGSSNYTDYPLIIKGATAKFTVDAKKGMKVVVTHGGNPVTPNEKGIYTIQEVTSDIEVNVDFSQEIITSNYYTNNGNIYLPKNISAFAIADKIDYNTKVIKVKDSSENDKLNDATIFVDDTVTLNDGKKDIASYKVKYSGDCDGNNDVTVTDVVKVIDHALGKQLLATAGVADIDNNGKITVSDIVAIRNSIINTDKTNYAPKVGPKSAITRYENDIKSRSGISSKITDQVLKNSVYNQGNRAGVANVIKKAMRGGTVNIAYFGGSITASAGKDATASVSGNTISESYGYKEWVNKWFKDTFEGTYHCTINLIDAGIGATDTVLSIHRMYEDVLSKKPDLIISEWAVNDGVSIKYKAGTYEAIIRESLRNNIPIVLFGMSTSNPGSSSQPNHRPLAEKYNLPMISYDDAYGQISEFSKFSGDGTHPNKLGHALAGLILNNYFGNVYKDIDKISNYISPLPADTYYENADDYQGAYIAKLADIADGKVAGARIISLGSFARSKDSSSFGLSRSYYSYKAPYSATYQPLVIEVTCKTAHILERKWYKYTDSSFSVKVDGADVADYLGGATFNCRSSSTQQTEGNYHWASYIIAKNAPSKKIRIEILPTNKLTTDSVELLALLLS